MTLCDVIHIKLRTPPRPLWIVGWRRSAFQGRFSGNMDMSRGGIDSHVMLQGFHNALHDSAKGRSGPDWRRRYDGIKPDIFRFGVEVQDCDQRHIVISPSLSISDLAYHLLQRHSSLYWELLYMYLPQIVYIFQTLELWQLPSCFLTNNQHILLRLQAIQTIISLLQITLNHPLRAPSL